ISKGLWRTTLEPATHPHLCTSRLLLLVEFGDGVLQRWGFSIPAILRNMFPAVLSILVPAMTPFTDELRPPPSARDTVWPAKALLWTKMTLFRNNTVTGVTIGSNQ